ARRLLDGVLTRQPHQLEALVERGKLALDERQVAEAEAWLRQAVDLAPADYQANYLLSQCLLQRGRAEEGRTLLAPVERLKADLRRLDEVVRQVRQNPQTPDPRSEAGRLFLRNGQAAEGLRWLDSALALDPLHGPTHQALAEHYEKTGDLDRAGRHRRLARLP